MARGPAAVPVPPVSAPLAGRAVQLLLGTQDPGLQGSSNVLLSAGSEGWAASEHPLGTTTVERACRGAGRGQELCVCKLYKEAFTGDEADLAKHISCAWVQQEPRESGGGLIGISLQRE